jgi:lipopolysaccharide transport system permease protein
MSAYLASVWNCRFFWLSLVKMDLLARYRRSVLGIGWSLLHPLATTLVICVVFHEIFKVNIREFVPFLLSGLAFWAYMVGVTVQGCQCFVQAESYIRQHSLPMAVYPLRTTLGALFHFATSLTMVLALTCILKGSASLSALLSLVPALFLLLVLGWALASLAGFVNVIFRDIQHIAEISFQILFYLTPIIYPAEVLRGTRAAWLLSFNPLAAFLELIRRPLVYGEVASMECFAVAASVTVLAAAAAIVSLGRIQRRVIFYL